MSCGFLVAFFSSCLFVKKMDTMMIEGEGMLTYYRTNRVGKRKSGIKKKKKKKKLFLFVDKTGLDYTVRRLPVMIVGL